MCIAVYKPEYEIFPSENILQNCFYNNPDGAGYMFPTNGKVSIRKGFMTFDDFITNLYNDRAIYGDMIPYVLHFRISTQAGVRSDCCHPFPLSDDMNELRRLNTTSKWGVAHNGVICMTSSTDKNLTYSDTMKFITDYLSLIVTEDDWWKDNRKPLLIERLIDGSRIAILDGTGHCELVGKWFNENGIYYSNCSYKYETIMDDFNDSIEDWEFFRDKDTGMYELTEDYCPLTVDESYDYCYTCNNFGVCTLLDYEALGL